MDWYDSPSIEYTKATPFCEYSCLVREKLNSERDPSYLRGSSKTEGESGILLPGATVMISGFLAGSVAAASVPVPTESGCAAARAAAAAAAFLRRRASFLESLFCLRIAFVSVWSNLDRS